MSYIRQIFKEKEQIEQEFQKQYRPNTHKTHHHLNHIIKKLTVKPDPRLPEESYWTANVIVKPDTGVAEESPKLKIGTEAKEWIRGASNEIGRLTQEVRGEVQGNNTITFIHTSQMPEGKKETYLKIVCDYRPQKEETL